MRNSSVQDMYSGNTGLDRIDTVLDLREHAAADISAAEQFFCFRNTQFGDQCGFVLRITVYTLDIR